MQQRPNPGEIYRHFKNKMYQVIAIARHSETGEEMVVYQALYGTFEIYVRPLSMFVSEVDREKYPAVTQKYRFEKIDREILKEPVAQMQEAAVQTAAIQKECTQEAAVQTAAIQKECTQEATGQTAATEENTRAEYAEPVSSEEESGVNPQLLAFLNTDTYEEKYKVLQLMRNDITDRLINDLSVVLDIAVDDGPLDQRYEQLKSALATLCKYEVRRLH